MLLVTILKSTGLMIQYIKTYLIAAIIQENNLNYYINIK